MEGLFVILMGCLIFLLPPLDLIRMSTPADSFLVWKMLIIWPVIWMALTLELRCIFHIWAHFNPFLTNFPIHSFSDVFWGYKIETAKHGLRFPVFFSLIFIRFFLPFLAVVVQRCIEWVLIEKERLKFQVVSFYQLSLHKKWSFPLQISSVNVTKSAGNREFGHIYWRNP